MYRISNMGAYSPYGSESTNDASKITSTSSPENSGSGNIAGLNGGANTMGIVHDPFVGSNKSKGEGKLSATASSFQPFGVGYNFTPLSPKLLPLKGIKLPKGVAPMPGTAEHVESIIAAAEKSPRRGASAPSSAPLVTKGGFFSTESVTNRHIKVTGIYIDDVDVRVQQSLEKFAKSEYDQKGTSRMERVKNIVYLAFTDVRDALAFSAVVARDHDKISVEFIQVNDLNDIDSPLATGIASAYEGQILVHVQYPLGCDRRQFEEEVRGLLAANNRSIHAWQKLLDREAGSFALVVEFHNVGDAKFAIQELHGKVIGIAPRATILSVCEHRPIVLKKATPPKLAPMATPIRKIPESNVIDLLGNLGINKGKAPEPVIMSFATPLNPAGFQYLPSANPAYSGPFGIASHFGSIYSSDSQATIGTGLGMGNMYAGMTPQPPYTMGSSMMGNMSTGTTPNMSYGMGSSMTGFSPYAPTPYADQGFTPTRFNQHEFGRLTPMGHPSFGAGNMSYGSPSAGQLPEFDYSPRPVRPVRRENAVKVPYHIAANYRRNQPSTGNHNVVEIDNINFGVDVRTTVMLRNIPNKVTQAELKKYVDQSSFGQYDFMYLRIDFSNDCNVGYAFINFVDPLDIVPFVNLRSGKKWDAFRSEKRAEVSYATIQGRDCLIQKFRNSSVMLEPPTARPKLFYVFPDPMVGQEEPFPEADNHSKLNRSCQNAENVGLFAPNAGQHLRDEQRRRRSQFDRGTTLAERDEYNFEYNAWGAHRYR